MNFDLVLFQISKLGHHHEADVANEWFDAAVLPHVAFDIADFIEDQVAVLVPASIINILPLRCFVVNQKGFIICVQGFVFVSFLQVVLVERRNDSLRSLTFLEDIPQSFLAGVEPQVALNAVFEVAELDKLGIIVPHEEAGPRFCVSSFLQNGIIPRF